MSVRSSTESNPIPAYRLCGEIEGVLRSFHLDKTVMRVGAQSGLDVVLPFSGVSREHAILKASGGGWIVEDRGSKNGTRVNGERVAHARIVAGDELTLGSVSLVLESIEAADAHLALVFDSLDDSPPEIGDTRETDLLESRPAVSPAASLRWIETFVTDRSAPDAHLAVALESLRAQMGSTALGAVLFGSNAAPTILGAAGEVEVMSRRLEQHSAVLTPALERARTGGWQLEILGPAADLVVGMSPLAGEETLSIVVLGDFSGRSTCGPLLRVLCRLIEIFESLGSKETPRSNTSPPGGLSFPDGFVTGNSSASRGLYRELEMVCGGNYPVLILGETGSGKEWITQTLHRSSTRASQPLVAVNCAAIPADLLEAEMFGVARGAATGVAPRPGCFARARGGTLFLDEIGEMPPELQAKLLRVLDSGEMQPVGGTPVEVDVRIVSATNIDVEASVARGALRADLYYRLAASVIQVPSLRERRDDLPALIQHFVQKFADELGLRLRGMSQRALELLMAYPWPGNLRELQHELRRLVQQALPGQTLDSSLLPSKIQSPAAAGLATVSSTAAKPSPADPPHRSLDLRERVAEVERQVIQEALAATDGQRRPAAKLLGISRNTLAAKILQYGLA